MAPVKVLLAGESWVSTGTHVKGFNHFAASEYQIGIAGLRKALDGSDIALTHLPGHLVPTEFPTTMDGLAAYDVVVLSDIGADSLLLHPDTFVRGQRTPNRLKLIADWVEAGGGFLMVGGYYSFQGINGAARYHNTPIEKILPVAMLSVDDRVEVPEGFEPAVAGAADHPAIDGIAGPWPYLLGFNEVMPKPDAEVILSAGADSPLPLLVAGKHGNGRTMAWTSDIGPHWLPDSFVSWPGYQQAVASAFSLGGRTVASRKARHSALLGDVPRETIPIGGGSALAFRKDRSMPNLPEHGHF